MRFFQRKKPDFEKSSEYTLDQFLHMQQMIRENRGETVVTPRDAMRAPTVSAIVKAFAFSTSALPFSMYQKSENSRNAAPDHELSRLFGDKPNRSHTSAEFWKLAARHCKLWGRFVAKKMTVNGRITEIIPIHPQNVQVKWDGTGRRVFKVSGSDVIQNGVYAQDQVLFVADMLDDDGLDGISPIQENEKAVALEIAAQDFGAQLFSGSAIPNVVIERPGRFKNDEDFERFRSRWNQLFRKRRGTAVIEQGWQIKPLQLSNEESQFLQTRQAQRSVIAGLYRVPPHIVGDLEKATYRNVEEMGVAWVSEALLPFLRSIETAIMRDCVTQSDKAAGFYPRFNVDGLLRGSAFERSRMLWVMRQAGVINANEWRMFEEMNPREDDGGNDYLTPGNMQVSGDADDDGRETDPAQTEAA